VLVGKLGRFDGQAGDCSRGVGESLAVALPSWLWPCGVGCGPTERARLLGCGVLSLEQGSLRGEGQIRGCHARWRPLYTGRPATPANSARYLGRICRLSEGIRGWHRVDEAARASGRWTERACNQACGVRQVQAAQAQLVAPAAGLLDV